MDIDEYMAPYRSLAAAVLSQAVKDACGGNPQVRKSAQQWLQRDTFCVELCEWLGYSHAALKDALEREVEDRPRRKRSLKTL